jgi:hypothetical protein
MVEIPYLNLGLLIGLKRSGHDKSRDLVPTQKNGWTVDMGIGGRARAYVKGWQRAQQSNMLGQFIHVNREQLSQFGSRPWFVPEEFGGFGLPETDHPDHRPSKSDIDLVISSDGAQCAVQKAQAVRKLDSPFHHACETYLAARFGTTSCRGASFRSGAFQWAFLKTTPLGASGRSWACSEKRSQYIAQRIADYWRVAWKHGGKAAEIVRNWCAEQGFDMENVTLEGATRQYYEQLLRLGPWQSLPKVSIRSEFLDEQVEQPVWDGLAGLFADQVGALEGRWQILNGIRELPW